MIQRLFEYLLKNQVIFALLLIIFGWFIYIARGVLVLFFLAYIIMSALLPFVTFFKKKGFPHVFSVIIPFFLLVLFLFVLIFPLITFFVPQVQSLLSIFPSYLTHSAHIFGFTINPQQLQKVVSSEVNNLGRNAFDVTFRVFGGLLSIFTVMISSFYLLYYHEQFRGWIPGLFRPDTRTHVLKTSQMIDEKLGAWARGQIVLSCFIGLLSWIAMSLLGVPYALPLALLAGMFEVLPTIGPILAALPAVIVALTISTPLALTVIGVYFIIQFVEGHILVPNIMQKAVGLNPIVVIFGILVGGKLMGIPGAFLSIPFISLATVLFQGLDEVLEKK